MKRKHLLLISSGVIIIIVATFLFLQLGQHSSLSPVSDNNDLNLKKNNNQQVTEKQIPATDTGPLPNPDRANTPTQNNDIAEKQNPVSESKPGKVDTPNNINQVVKTDPVSVPEQSPRNNQDSTTSQKCNDDQQVADKQNTVSDNQDVTTSKKGVDKQQLTEEQIPISDKTNLPQNDRTQISSQTDENNNSLLIALFGANSLNKRSTSDAIMLIKYNPQPKEIILVSVPPENIVKSLKKNRKNTRTTYVLNRSQQEKFSLEDLFQIKIDYYLKTNYQGFIKIIDTLGGITVKTDQDFLKQLNGNTSKIKDGKITLNGKETLKYVRYIRKPDGRLNRMKRQQKIFISLVEKMIKTENIIKIPEIVNILRNNIRTDIDWHEIINIGWKLKNIHSISRIEQYALQPLSRDEDSVTVQTNAENNLIELSKKLR